MEASIHENSEVSEYELAKLHELVLGKHSILIKEPEFSKSGKADPDANWIFERRNIDLKLEETSYFLQALRQQIRIKPDEDKLEKDTWIEKRQTEEALRILDDLDQELMKDNDWKAEVKKEWQNLQKDFHCNVEVNELNNENENQVDSQHQQRNNKNINEERQKAQIINNVNQLNSEMPTLKNQDYMMNDPHYLLKHYEQLQNWLLQLKHYYVYMEDKFEPNYIALLATAKRLSHKLKEGRVLAWLIARSETTPSKYRISLGRWFIANLPIVQGKAKVRARLRDHKNIVLKRQGLLRESMVSVLFFFFCFLLILFFSQMII